VCRQGTRRAKTDSGKTHFRATPDRAAGRFEDVDALIIALPVFDPNGLSNAITIWLGFVAVGGALVAWLVKAPAKDKAVLAVAIMVFAFAPFLLMAPIKTPNGLPCGSALQPPTPASPSPFKPKPNPYNDPQIDVNNIVGQHFNAVGYDGDKCEGQHAFEKRYAGFAVVGSLIMIGLVFFDEQRRKAKEGRTD
jgi:hypothetical protein